MKNRCPFLDGGWIREDGVGGRIRVLEVASSPLIVSSSTRRYKAYFLLIEQRETFGTVQLFI